MDRKESEQDDNVFEDGDLSELTELRLFIPESLAKAWQRCSWLIVHETGRQRTDVMEEMVRDYLLKYGC